MMCRLQWTASKNIGAFLVLLFIAANGYEQDSEISPEGDVVLPIQVSDVEDTYGVDVSWATHYRVLREHASVDGRNREDQYTKHLLDCARQGESCSEFENDRLEMNLLQPKAMENYTHAGYARVDAPRVVEKMLTEVWEAHKGEQTPELWEKGNIYVNHWESQTSMVDIGRHLSEERMWRIVDEVQSVLEAWTKQALVLTSVYGIRVYKDGAVMAPHVDRLPLVSSAIINVAQDVDEPWVLEVIGHDGKAHNITTNPGQMVLYESHSVIHGRPFALNGRYFANVFVHFEPLGHTLRHSQKGAYGSDIKRPQSARDAYEAAMKEQQQEHVESNFNTPTTTKVRPPTKPKTPDMPPYVPPEKEVEWKQQYDFEKEEKRVSPKAKRRIQKDAGLLAAAGLLGLLKELAERDRSVLFRADQNGWTPLHEAARSGQADVLEYLLEEGAQVNQRTNDGMGGNALFWAEKKKDEPKFNEAIAVLKKHGAVSLPPLHRKKKN